MLSDQSFSLRDFIAKPDSGMLLNISKYDWIGLAKFYNVEIATDWNKQDIANAVCEYFKTNNILSEEDCLFLVDCGKKKKEKVGQSSGSDGESSGTEGEHSSGGETGAKSLNPKKSVKPKKKAVPVNNELTESQMEFQLRMKQMETEAEQKKIEAEQKKLEAKLKERQLEIEAEKMKFEAKKIELEIKKLGDRKDDQVKFSVDHAVKSVPLFLESEVDSFFLQFEKIAVQRNWPKDQWSTLVQTSFTGKARDVYAAMSLSDSQNYDIVKREVLKAYEWVSERYREKFRGWQKRDYVNHMEFAREQKLWFDRWVSSKNVDKDYDKLEELILLEQFKVRINPNIKMYLDEREIDTVEEATRLADNYAITHGLNRLGSRNAGTNVNRRNHWSPSEVWQSPPSPKKKGNFSKREKSNISNTSGSFSSSKGNFSDKAIVCFKCGKSGHISRYCQAFVKANAPMQVLNTESESKSSKANSKENESATPIALLDCKVEPCLLEAPPHSGKLDLERGVDCLSNDNLNCNNDIVEINDNDNCILTCDKTESDCSLNHLFDPYIGNGVICSSSGKKPIRWLRDTGGAQSVLLESTLPMREYFFVGDKVLLRGFGEPFFAPRVKINIETPLISKEVTVALVKEIPLNNVDLVLANDLCGRKVFAPDPIVVDTPILESNDDFEIFPACAVTTRSGGKNNADEDLGLAKLFQQPNLENENVGLDKLKMSKEDFVEQQKQDSELKLIFDNAVDYGDSCREKERICYFVKNDVLCRKFRSRKDNSVTEQIVVPIRFRNFILNIAHNESSAGHFGINKTFDKVSRYFYWPGIRKDVTKFCKSCDLCQRVGKTPLKVVPLKPIKIEGEPFQKLVLDCVGPLPRTSKGNEYLFTIMCPVTRFPEAIPLRSINADKLIEALQKFFSFVGIPKTIQTDQGSNFMSKKFQNFLESYNITHEISSPYHPQSQGVIERFHRTFKTMLKTYSNQNEKIWDTLCPMLIFAVRDTVQDSIGYSPFQLIFTHNVRSPLGILKEQVLEDEELREVNLDEIKAKIRNTWKLAKDNLIKVQEVMKERYDSKSETRQLNVNDQVLVLIPTPGKPFQFDYVGPYKVKQKLSEENYVVEFPTGRRKEKKFHINNLKKYTGGNGKSTLMVLSEPSNIDSSEGEVEVRLNNSTILKNLEGISSHLRPEQQHDLIKLIEDFRVLFPDNPTRSSGVQHTIKLLDETPIRQSPYRMSPKHKKAMEKEVAYLEEHGLAEPSNSPWASPCILVKKPDNSFRMCTDYRKVNMNTVKDSYPLPRIDDIIDSISNSPLLSKVDLLRGYYQIELEEGSRKVAAFITPQGLFEYTVMPFGLANAPHTFQRHLNLVLRGIEGVYVYLDDVVITGKTWKEHLEKLKLVFEAFAKHNITINLSKCDFGKATVKYLGHEVGSGTVKPLNCHIKSISSFPVPQCKKEVMKFLGTVGYYRKFCKNFSDVAHPLTELLKKKIPFNWDSKCDIAFNNLKLLLMSKPVLKAPDFEKPFILQIDSSEVGAGSVLLQDYDGVLHPVSYFSHKYDEHQKNYHIVEKEALSLILSLKHFEIYVNSSDFPILILTDNNPLTFINKCKGNNKRILRWSIFLQGFNLEIKHIKGKFNVIADALSRAV